MADYTHENLPLYGKHVPGFTVEPGQSGVPERRELPGMYQIWTEIEGVPVLLFERKAGKLLSKIAQGKQQPQSPQSPSG